MSASLLERNPVDEQVQSLTALVRQLQLEVCELRRENAELRQQVRQLQCDVGYWRSMHARAVQKNAKLQAELDQALAGLRRADRLAGGRQSLFLLWPAAGNARSERRQRTDRDRNDRLSSSDSPPTLPPDW